MPARTARTSTSTPLGLFGTPLSPRNPLLAQLRELALFDVPDAPAVVVPTSDEEGMLPLFGGGSDVDGPSAGAAGSEAAPLVDVVSAVAVVVSLCSSACPGDLLERGRHLPGCDQAEAVAEAVAEAAPTVHRFRSTADAYDACQAGGRVAHGDVLVVRSEGVVGVLDGAWPVALTDQTGEFHGLVEGHPGAEEFRARLAVSVRVAEELAGAL